MFFALHLSLLFIQADFSNDISLYLTLTHKHTHTHKQTNTNKHSCTHSFTLFPTLFQHFYERHKYKHWAVEGDFLLVHAVTVLYLLLAFWLVLATACFYDFMTFCVIWNSTTVFFVKKKFLYKAMTPLSLNTVVVVNLIDRRTIFHICFIELVSISSMLNVCIFCTNIVLAAFL